MAGRGIFQIEKDLNHHSLLPSHPFERPSSDSTHAIAREHEIAPSSTTSLLFFGHGSLFEANAEGAARLPGQLFRQLQGEKLASSSPTEESRPGGFGPGGCGPLGEPAWWWFPGAWHGAGTKGRTRKTIENHQSGTTPKRDQRWCGRWKGVPFPFDLPATQRG